MTTGDPAVPDATDEPIESGVAGATITIDRSAADVETAEISEYVNTVKELLSDLDRDELDDLIHDLELHLREIRADTDEPFITVVGTPQDFATELRQSAGFGTAPPLAPDPGPVARMKARLARFLHTKLNALRAHAWGRAVLEFLPELRPGWWVGRGYMLGVAVGWMTSESPLGLFGIPRFGGSVIAGLVATAVLIVLSVRGGRRQYGRRLERGAVWLAGLVAVVTALAAANTLAASGYDNNFDAGIETVPVIEADWTILPANIHAYLPDGTPLDQVLLFDEAGDPVDLPESGFSERLDSPFEAPPEEIDGRPVANLYPRQLWTPTGAEDMDDGGYVVDEHLQFEDSWSVVPAPTVGPPFATTTTSTRTSTDRPTPSTTTPAAPNTDSTSSP